MAKQPLGGWQNLLVEESNYKKVNPKKTFPVQYFTLTEDCIILTKCFNIVHELGKNLSVNDDLKQAGAELSQAQDS